MSETRIPRWTWWILGALALWLGWGLGIGHPLVKATADLEHQRQDTERQLTGLKTGIAAVPQHVARLEQAIKRLDSAVASFHTRRRCHQLVRQLRSEARSRGLVNVVVDPDLTCLLANPPRSIAHEGPLVKLDTIIIDLSAQGQFTVVGEWLDTIEKRADFRYWVACNWSSAEESGYVGFAGRFALVVVDRVDSVEESTGTEASG